ncbi:MAG: hypothetical protein ABEJ93_03335 [Candidatus Nanohalobium sp.]
MKLFKRIKKKIEELLYRQVKKNTVKLVKTYLEFKIFQKIWRTIWKKLKK